MTVRDTVQFAHAARVDLFRDFPNIVVLPQKTTSPTSAEGRRPWEYCGEVYPLVMSDTSMVSVEFRTDLDSKSLGFLAEYTSTGKGVISVSNSGYEIMRLMS